MILLLIFLVILFLCSGGSNSELSEEDNKIAVNAEDIFILGMKYYNGDGVSENRTKAAKLFQKAAEQGYARAQLMLGHIYSIGGLSGYPQD